MQSVNMKALAWHPAALHSSNVCPRLCGRSWQPRLSTHRGDGSIASCSGRPGHSGSTSVALSGQRAEGSEESCGVGRRAVLAGAALTLTCLRSTPAGAFVTPPPGYRVHQDKLDGYLFFVPENWLPVTTSGNDIFYRNPYNVNENLFVDVSSPSSSNFSSVEDLGPPEAAAKRTLNQYLEELMSTRLGVQRKGEVLSADRRTGPDGREYYDIQVRVRSYASRNQLAAYPGDRQAGQELEWERRYLTVLGAANKRLYQFRLQTADKSYEKAAESLLDIAQSFRCKEVVT